MISSTILSQFFSLIDFPTLFPKYSIKLLAIPPTIIILSNLGIKFLITLILVEILDPPIIQVIGLVISEIILLSALTSKSSCNPENEGKNFGILLIEA